MFKRNESPIDRVIRAVAGVALLVAAFATLGAASGELLGIVVAIVGGVLLFTAITGFCLLYTLLHLDTSK